MTAELAINIFLCIHNPSCSETDSKQDIFTFTTEGKKLQTDRVMQPFNSSAINKLLMFYVT